MQPYSCDRLICKKLVYILVYVGGLMIRDLSEMPALVHFLLGDVETEVVEYKEAK